MADVFSACFSYFDVLVSNFHCETLSFFSSLSRVSTIRIRLDSRDEKMMWIGQKESYVFVPNLFFIAQLVFYCVLQGLEVCRLGGGMGPASDKGFRAQGPGRDV